MDFLNHLDDTALLEKSARHLIDALEERKKRNDIDYHGKGVFYLCFIIQQAPLFLTLLEVSNWVYILLAFLEPTQLYDISLIDLDMLQVTNIFEIVIMSIFACNFLLEALLLVSTYTYTAVIIHKNKTCFKRFCYIILYENWMSTSVLLLDIVFFVDIIAYRMLFPYQIFRFTRLLRPGRTS